MLHLAPIRLIRPVDQGLPDEAPQPRADDRIGVPASGGPYGYAVQGYVRRAKCS